MAQLSKKSCTEHNSIPMDCIGKNQCFEQSWNIIVDGEYEEAKKCFAKTKELKGDLPKTFTKKVVID